MMSNHIIERMESEEKAHALRCQELGYVPERDENCFIWFNPFTGGFIYDGSTVSNSLIQNMLLDNVIVHIGMSNNLRLKYELKYEDETD